MKISTSMAILFSLLAACGSGSGGTAADGGGSQGPCGFEDRYLPYQPGYSWAFKVTNLASPEVTTKSQSLSMESDAQLGEVIVQTTSKDTGTTISKLRREGEAVLRLQQVDLDAVGNLERTTVYDPYQVRLDEAPDKLSVGAAWDDLYDITVTDSAGTQLVAGSRTDHWEIMGVDVDCSSPLGDFRCLHVRRLRTVGGISDKEYFFARGVGKVKEVNANQIEELVACE